MILDNFEAFEVDLQRRLRPVYLMLGPEQYLCRQAFKLLKKKALTPGSEDFDCSEFSSGQSSIDAIKEAMATYPMLSGKRLVLVRDVDKLEDFEQEALLKALDKLSSRNMAAVTAVELDRRKKFYKTFIEKYCVVEFKMLKGKALERWAAGFFSKQGHAISPVSIKKIVEIAGADLQTLAIEFEKLMLHAGDQKTISDEAIEDLVRSGRQHGIFELVDAVAERNRDKAIRSLANLLSAGEHPLVITSMLARHCRQILIARECLGRGKTPDETAAAALIPYFMLDRFLHQARIMDIAAVKEMFAGLAAADRQLKSTQLNGKAMLERLICGLLD
ncbi:MAG TPA: DNA polymerase III subunit delta [Acidobacteriota bacterium]|nr:DNA polymerase III subunit delta [Acidobacteriota bacterium]